MSDLQLTQWGALPGVKWIDVIRKLFQATLENAGELSNTTADWWRPSLMIVTPIAIGNDYINDQYLHFCNIPHHDTTQQQSVQSGSVILSIVFNVS